jgi:hypothetical protein
MPEYELLWKHQCERSLFFCQKNLNDTWLDAFKRCCNSQSTMLKQFKFNYQTCSIRQKSFVHSVEHHHNLIFTSDILNREVVLNLINEKDLENEDDTL